MFLSIEYPRIKRLKTWFNKFKSYLLLIIHYKIPYVLSLHAKSFLQKDFHKFIARCFIDCLEITSFFSKKRYKNQLKNTVHQSIIKTILFKYTTNEVTRKKLEDRYIERTLSIYEHPKIHGRRVVEERKINRIINDDTLRNNNQIAYIHHFGKR